MIFPWASKCIMGPKDSHMQGDADTERRDLDGQLVINDVIRRLVHTFRRGAARSTCPLRYLLVRIRRLLTTIDPPINVVCLSNRQTRAIIGDVSPDGVCTQPWLQVFRTSCNRKKPLFVATSMH